ncbi:MAG TPA: outer membrane beta-barrel protein [Pyrinomonadaceae bacterium]
MLRKKFFVAIAIISLLVINGLDTNAQSPDEDGRRFEVGAQVSVLNLSRVQAAHSATNPCLSPPCPSGLTIDYAQEAEPGFGGRIGYHLTNYLGVEAEVNFFPRDDLPASGRAFEGLFGVKAGRRFEKIGVYAKARPGVFSARTIDFRPKEGVGCIAVFPPPATCFDERQRRETSFAFDVGGILEFYPTKHASIRFDAGDTIIRFDERLVRASSTAFPAGVIVTAPARTSHNFQGSVGVGFRF